MFAAQKILFGVLIFFQLNALVQPIAIDEGMWNVLTRVGIGTDAIESKVCLLQSGLSKRTIDQSDIGVGGSFVISAADSGMVLCLTSSISCSVDPAIEINGAYDVTLDLNNYAIDVVGNDISQIRFSGADSSNIIIKNGLFVDSTATTIGSCITADDNLTIDGLTIQDSTFREGFGYSILFQESDLFVDNCILENCFFDSKTGVRVENAQGVIVRDCRFNVFFESCSIQGKSSGERCRYASVEDCIITGSFNSGSGGLLIKNANIASCKNTQVLSNITTFAFGAFAFDTVNHVSVSECKSIDSSTSAFIASNVRSAQFNSCISIDSNNSAFQVSPLMPGLTAGNVEFRDCLALAGGTGFAFFGSSDVVCNLIVKNCSVIDSFSGLTISLASKVTCENFIVDTIDSSINTGYGISIESSSMSEGYSFERCVIQNTESHGVFIRGTDDAARIGDMSFIDCAFMNAQSTDAAFYVFAEAADSGVVFDNIVLRGCRAINSDGKGFWFRNLSNNGAISNIIFDSCIAQNCASDGFVIAGTSDNVFFKDCIAQANEGIGFALTATVAMPYSIVCFKDCIAKENGLEGFSCNNMLCGSLKDCSALSNVLDGFSFDATTTLLKIIDCISQENGGIGFSNGSGEANRFMGNAAFDNAGGDYVGVSPSDGSKIVQYSNPGAIVGIGPWVNVSG